MFPTLAEAACRDESSPLEFLAALVAEEVAPPPAPAGGRLRFAHFPARRTLGDFDFRFQPSIDPKVIADLAGLGFMEAETPILLLGKPGCGKSISQSPRPPGPWRPATEATSPQPPTWWRPMTTAYADGSFSIKLRTYTGPSVLVIDDVGITPFGRVQSNAFFQVLNRRYENRSATIAPPTGTAGVR